MASFARKISWAGRILSSGEMWRILLRERQKSKPTKSQVECKVLEEDRMNEMYLAEVGGERYWLPLSMRASMMTELYQEVFDPTHPHYYEHEGCRLRSGDVVVDAGACEGLFTRYALQKGASVIAVEPWKPMADALRRTFAKEIEAGRVVIIQASLAETDGEAVLRYNPASPWGASIGAGTDSSDTEIPSHLQSDVVPQFTLDSIVAQSPWKHCDFIKMDIEGAECVAVAGANETLRRDKPCLAIAVYHLATGYLDIRERLLNTGLDYSVVGKGIQPKGGLFVPVILHAWSRKGPEK